MSNKQDKQENSSNEPIEISIPNDDDFVITILFKELSESDDINDIN